MRHLRGFKATRPKGRQTHEQVPTLDLKLIETLRQARDNHWNGPKYTPRDYTGLRLSSVKKTWRMA